MYSLNTDLGTPVVGSKSAVGSDWFSSRDLRTTTTTTTPAKSPRNTYRHMKENDAPRQRVKTGMERWEDHLSDFHLQPRTVEQQRSIKAASKKVPFKPLANANSLPKWHTTHSQTANAMMAFHGTSPKSKKTQQNENREHRPEWKGPSASDPKWKQLKDWHNRENVSGNPYYAKNTIPAAVITQPRKVEHKVQPKPLETPLPMSIPHPSYHPKSQNLSEVMSSHAAGSVTSSVAAYSFKMKNSNQGDDVIDDDTSSRISKSESIASRVRWAGTSN